MKAGSKTMPPPRAATSASRSPLFECKRPLTRTARSAPQRAFVEGAAAFGEAHPPRRAVEEPGLELRFEFRHLPRGRRGRESQALRRLGEGPRLHDPGEHLHGGEAVHWQQLSRYSKQT